jgi:hypothetical protein
MSEHHLKQARRFLIRTATLENLECALRHMYLHLESSPEVQPHRHQFGPWNETTSLPIPEPREETPQSGHTSQGSSSASPEEITPSTPETDTGELINLTSRLGPQWAEAAYHPLPPPPSKTPEPTSFMPSEEASRGRSASIDDLEAFVEIVRREVQFHQSRGSDGPCDCEIHRALDRLEAGQ